MAHNCFQKLNRSKVYDLRHMKIEMQSLVLYVSQQEGKQFIQIFPHNFDDCQITV